MFVYTYYCAHACITLYIHTQAKFSSNFHLRLPHPSKHKESVVSTLQCKLRLSLLLEPEASP